MRDINVMEDPRFKAKLAMKRAHDIIKVGRQYFLPLPNLITRDDVEDAHRLCTCVSKCNHFCVFRTPKGYNVTFLWSELGGILDERLCSE